MRESGLISTRMNLQKGTQAQLDEKQGVSCGGSCPMSIGSLWLDCQVNSSESSREGVIPTACRGRDGGGTDLARATTHCSREM
jgi:hypothetical protein